MSHFQAKMHQIRFSSPQTALEELTDPLAVFEGPILLRGGRGRGEEGKVEG